MPDYTITAVSEKTRDWETKNGEFRSYYLKVEGDEKTYELAQKRKTDPPKVGDSLEANVETREHDGTTYYQLKRVYQQGGRGGGGKSPSEQRRIAMQASQKVAADVAIAQFTKGESIGNLKDHVLTIAKDLYDQVESVA